VIDDELKFDKPIWKKIST